MSIDVDAPGSHGWWMKRLARKQADRLPALSKLHKRYIGESPEPSGPEQSRAAFAAFQKLARTSYEDTIVRAVLDRQTVNGFRTAAADDDGGDTKAAELWAANEGPIFAADVLEAKLSMREGYAMVGPPTADSDGQAIITAEDPRQVITAHDPARPALVRAGLKMFYDEDEGLEVAYIALRGGVRRDDGTTSTGAVVRRAQRKASRSSLDRLSDFRFSPGSWDWVPDPSWNDNALELRTARPPFVRFQNRNGMAEFEKHIDLIDRIRHTILQRMVIITLQAFRQRAVKGMPDRYPDDWPEVALRGQKIDYSGLFTADPAAVWLLPGMADLWESGDLDLTPVLEAVKSDIREMAAVTRTPFGELMPDSANQSAEGATVAREGIVFKTEDHNTRDGIRFADVMSLAFEQMGETARAKRGQLETLWAPVERFSLAQKADSAQKAKGIRPRLAILTDVWQLPPAQAKRELDMLDDDMLMAVDAAPVPGQEPPVRVRATRTDQPPVTDPAIGPGPAGGGPTV